jgi:hypothetical protein
MDSRCAFAVGELDTADIDVRNTAQGEEMPCRILADDEK